MVLASNRKCFTLQVYSYNWTPTGRDNSVGTAILYGLDGPGIEFRLHLYFPYLSREALGLT
jgi:hypothetical protein